MRKITICLCLCLFLCPFSALGAAKNVTITWTMADTSNVLGYKMYYSYSSNMADKQLACQTSNTTATTLTCENVTLNQSPAYFVIAALIAGDEVDSTASAESFVSSISPVQGFHMETTGSNTPPHAAISTNTTSGQAPLTVHFDAGQSSDSDGSIASYTWNFGDGSSSDTSISPSHTYTTTGSFQATLTVTDDQGATAIAHSTITTYSTSPDTYMINFQPGDSPAAEGFSIDSGLYFDAERGYGWNSYLPNTRDRDNPSSPDQSYDTNVIYIDNSNIWEIAIPNGDYNVTICTGDPDHPHGFQSVQIEGVTVINGHLSDNTKWIEQTISTTVTDGHLTMSFEESDESRLCWIKINPN